MTTRVGRTRYVDTKTMSHLIFRLKVRVNAHKEILRACCRNATIAASLNRPKLRELAPAIAVLPMLLGLIRLV
jgi:hypothetical protein